MTASTTADNPTAQPIEAIAVLTSGGDAPGMNAAVRAVTQAAAAQGIVVWGVENGFDGLIDGRLRPLTTLSRSLRPVVRLEVDQAAGQGGTILGTARSPRFLTPASRAEAARTFSARNLSGLVVIGGNGSLAGAHAIASEHGIPVVGIPASIDNDIGLTRESIGVDTALNTIVEACDRISDTASAHRRAFVIEVMGRDSGYLAFAAANATFADAVLLPELRLSAEEAVATVADALLRCFAPNSPKRQVIIIKAEGVPISTETLVAKVTEELERAAPYTARQVDIRATVLGHIVRGGVPTFRDRMLAGRMGLAAVEALVGGHSDAMVGWDRNTGAGIPTEDSWVQLFPIPDVLAETEALLSGESPVTRDRMSRMSRLGRYLSA